MQFLVDAFGFAVATDWSDPDDPSHVNVEAALGQGVVSICRANPQAGFKSPRSLDADHFGLYVEIDDVDGHFERAREAGATITSPIERQPWGARMYGARDPEGYGWSFAEPERTFPARRGSK